MSKIHIDGARYLSKCKGTAARCVLYAIAIYADNDGNAFPSIRTLAKRCSCTQPTVLKAIRHLVAIGEITVSRKYTGNRKHGGYQYCNVYHVNLRFSHQQGAIATIAPSTPKVLKSLHKGAIATLAEVPNEVSQNLDEHKSRVYIADVNCYREAGIPLDPPQGVSN